jgi:flagellar biogenesis protein FliO
MTAKSIAAPLPHFTEALHSEVPPFPQHLRSATRWLLQRFTRTANTVERVLAVEDRVAIGPKKSLMVVRCHGQRFLVGTCGDTIGPVIEVTPPKPPRRNRMEREA